MDRFRAVLFIFVYIVLLCPICEILCHAFAKSAGSLDWADHVHKKQPPCEVCPRLGQCVPRIRCPAHLRAGSFNPECHLATGEVGVCCFTGRHHAAESEWRSRQRAPIDIEHVKAAYNFSHTMVEKVFRQSEAFIKGSGDKVMKAISPDFGHHLSFIPADQRATELGRGGLLNLFAVQELKSRQAVDENELLLSLTDHTDGPYCVPPPSCPEPPDRYRSLNGECNNAANPTWGAANTAFERLSPPDYADGIWSMRTSVTGLPLPSAREVSAALLPDGDHPSDSHNMLFMQFSQFVTHDISATVIINAGNNSAISCCTPDGSHLSLEQLHFACAPIAVDPGDNFYKQFGKTCLNFVRAQPAPSTDCTLGYANAMNGVTHFLDLSQLYGNTPEKLQVLQSGAMLKTFNDYGRELPPVTDRQECMSKEENCCFESGENRGNQIVSLTALHLVFTREHNRIARAFTRLNPLWDEDSVFYETRRLLQAMFQHIVYNEWLPLILGPNMMKMYNLTPSAGSYSTKYDPRVNPSLLAEFSAAAMRFGHSTIDGKIIVPYPKTGKMYEAVSIPEVMLEPSRLRLRPFLDRLLYGLSCQPMQAVDPLMSVGLTQYLFRGGSPHGLDLAALNVQRGRDLGLRSHAYHRRLVGVQPYDPFQQFPFSVYKRLSSVYASPEDIDLWIGGLLEEHIEGGIVGPTFAHIIAEQFFRLKQGDRYYYENGPETNPAAFTMSQLAEIKKITFARIVCDNRDGIELTAMPPQAFLRADLSQNSPVPCDSVTIPSIDLNRFKVI